MNKRWIAVAALSFLLATTVSAESPPTYSPGFAEPVWHKMGNDACAASAVSATRAPDNSALSILRDADFLAVGNRLPRSAHARCAFDVRFTEPLKAHQTVLLNIRAMALKTSDSKLQYKIQLGPRQLHSFVFAPGSPSLLGQ